MNRDKRAYAVSPGFGDGLARRIDTKNTMDGDKQ